MSIFADLGFLGCLTALAAMISLSPVAFLHATDQVRQLYLDVGRGVPGARTGESYVSVTRVVWCP